LVFSKDATSFTVVQMMFATLVPFGTGLMTRESGVGSVNRSAAEC
jgi:hypothetical protein